MDIFQILALTGVVVGSYTDIRTLEVPDWLNYSLIAIGLCGNLIFSIAFSNNIYIVRSLLGLGVSLIIGLLMFYTGQWGGGDSKMIFGLGALLGLDYPFQSGFYVKFLINMLFAGALYGLLWVSVLAFKNIKTIKKQYIKSLKEKKYRKIRYISGILAIFILAILYFVKIDNDIRFVLALMTLILYFTNYLFIFVRIVENVAMIKEVSPKQLTEGDWIVEDVKLKGEKIVGPKDLGITKKQIKILQDSKLKKIKVKYGIPFVPSFLIAMLYTLITNDIFLLQIVF